MQHLDEGLLQAWLDHPRSGLEPSEVAEIERHLASCDACARELEALRGDTTEAQALLAGGVDRTAPRPPFEDVVRRARGHEEVRRARRRLNRLAWAASLVVALGVGWWSNDLYRQARTYEAERAPAVVPPAAQEAPAAEELEAIEPQVGARRAPARVDDVAASDEVGVQVVPEAAAERREQDAFADRAQPAPAAEPTRAANELAAGAGAPVQAAPVIDSLRAYQDAARPARQAAPSAAVDADDGIVVTGVVRDERGGAPVASAQVYVEGLNVGALTQQDGSYRLVVPARDSVDVTVARIGYRTEKQAVSGRPGEPVVADFRLEEEALALQEVIVTGDVGAAALVVEAVLGREPARVPTLAVRSVDLQGDLVRVRQDLGDAVVLTLVQGRAVAGTDQWQVESAGAVASRRIGDLLVTATAPLTQDSLRALLDAVR
jgi:hypothetical protein